MPDGHMDNAASTVLITGSNRGIGFEFVRQYAAKGWNVIATARTPHNAANLNALANDRENVVIEELDVTNHDMIDALRKKYTNQPIDVLLNNAGISGAPTPEQMFGQLAHEQTADFFRTNAVGPLKLSEAFVENICASNEKTIVVVSSLAGSFAAGGGGAPGVYFYKASKAALNMFMTQVARDTSEKGVKVVMLSPGIVNSDNRFGDVKIPGMVPIDESVAGMIRVIEGLTGKQSGTFIRYSGQPQGF